MSCAGSCAEACATRPPFLRATLLYEWGQWIRWSDFVDLESSKVEAEDGSQLMLPLKA